MFQPSGWFALLLSTSQAHLGLWLFEFRNTVTEHVTGRKEVDRNVCVLWSLFSVDLFDNAVDLAADLLDGGLCPDFEFRDDLAVT